MHELSIAEAIADTVRRVCPAGRTVVAVTVEAGPMRGIVQEAMDHAWAATVAGTDLAEARLEVHVLPWRLTCPSCGKVFESSDVYATCACGEAGAYPVDCDGLVVKSLEVR